MCLDRLGQVGDIGATAHYLDPAYYAKAYRAREDDVAFYVDLATQLGGPVLEYGVGSGRIAVPIARRGVEVFGVDLCPEMLGALEQQLKLEDPSVRRGVRWRRGDMRRARLRRRFPLVLATFNTFLHLYNRRDVEAFLGKVAAHLTPSGVFAFDFSLPQGAELGRDPTRRFGAPRFRHPTTGAMTRYAERFEYDAVRQLLLVHMEFMPEDGAPYVVPLTHREYAPQEVDALLFYNGFRVVEWVTDFGAGGDTAPDSVVAICKLRGRRGARARGLAVSGSRA